MNLFRDLPYNLYLLKKNLGFSCLCISVVAFGIAVILPFFNLVENMGFKSPPFENGDKYVSIPTRPDFPPFTPDFSFFDEYQYNYYKENATSFSTIQAWRNLNVTISDGEFSETYTSAIVQPSAIELTGISALLGRLLTPDDSLGSAEPVVIISYSLWQSYYTGDENIIGHQSRINGETRTIIGVMPEGYKYPLWHDLWLPLELLNTPNPGENIQDLVLTGILKDNVTREDATVEIQLLEQQLKTNLPQVYQEQSTTSVAPYNGLRGIRPNTTPLLLIASSIVALIAFNIAILFIARGEERIMELATRSALGADSSKVASTLMQESFLICFFGLIIGLLLSTIGLNFLNGMITNISPQMTDFFWWDMSLNISSVVTASVSIFIIWIVTGGLPARKIARTDLNSILSEAGKGSNERGSTLLNRVLVNIQLILGCILLSVGLTSSFGTGNGTLNTGINSDGLFTGQISFNDDNFSSDIFRLNYLSTFEQSLVEQQGVSEVGYSSSLPGDGGFLVNYNIEDNDLIQNDVYPQQFQLSISNNYFDLLNVKMLQGRSFSSEDNTSSLQVAIIDQRLADILWPDITPIGKRIQINPESNTEWLTIVGVSSNVIQEGMLMGDNVGTPIIFRPLQQKIPNELSIIFRSTQNSVDYISLLRKVASQVNRDIPISSIQSIAEKDAALVAATNSNNSISMILIFIALYLTSIAIYGLAARSVSKRKIEMGIRMALGADKRRLTLLFLKEGVLTVFTGLLVGGILAVLFTYIMLSSSGMGNSFNIIIPVTLSICLIMGSLVLLANYFPAKKIIAMEPGDALRYD